MGLSSSSGKACLPGRSDVSDLPLVPSSEHFFFSVRAVVVLLIEISSFFVFLQDPDDELRAALFSAFLFKKPQHLRPDAHSQMIRINIKEMKLEGSFFVVILTHADPHHPPDDACFRIFVYVYVKPLFGDPSLMDRNAVLNGQVLIQAFLRKYLNSIKPTPSVSLLIHKI